MMRASTASGEVDLRTSPARIRWAVCCLVLGVAALDASTSLPAGLLYVIPIWLTTWSRDRWLPMATSVGTVVLLLAGATRKTLPATSDILLMSRGLGAALLLAAGWLVSRYRRLLTASNRREAILRGIFDAEPACVKLVSQDGELIDMNRAGLSMVEADRPEDVIGTCLSRLVVARHRPAFIDLAKRVFAGGTGVLQFEIVGLKGTPRWMETHAAPLKDRNGLVTALLCISHDITERVHTEERLRDVERRINQAVEIAGLGFFEHGRVGEAVYWSPNARRIVGLTDVQEIALEEACDMVHPDDRAKVRDAVAAALTPSGDGLLSLEHRIARNDGDTRHVSVKAQALFAGEGVARQPVRLVGTMLDITERKRAEAQRDALARRLLDAQEAERRAVSRDLHDEVGQALSALKLNLLRLRREGTGDLQIVNDSLRITDEVLQETRDIALALRPSVLDDLGLEAAIQWYSERTAERTGLAVACDIQPDLPRVEPQVEIGCFRVLQESLTNVLRHARAQNVVVSVRHQSGSLEIAVRDDGVGFDVDTALGLASRGSNMGLLSLHERVSLLGGTAAIRSAPDAGCEVRVAFPLLLDSPQVAAGSGVA